MLWGIKTLYFSVIGIFERFMSNTVSEVIERTYAPDDKRLLYAYFGLCVVVMAGGVLGLGFTGALFNVALAIPFLLFLYRCIYMHDKFFISHILTRNILREDYYWANFKGLIKLPVLLFYVALAAGTLPFLFKMQFTFFFKDLLLMILMVSVDFALFAGIAYNACMLGLKMSSLLLVAVPFIGMFLQGLFLPYSKVTYCYPFIASFHNSDAAIITFVNNQGLLNLLPNIVAAGLVFYLTLIFYKKRDLIL